MANISTRLYGPLRTTSVLPVLNSRLSRRSRHVLWESLLYGYLILVVPKTEELRAYSILDNDGHYRQAFTKAFEKEEQVQVVMMHRYSTAVIWHRLYQPMSAPELQR